MTQAREMDVLVAGEIYIDLILSGFDQWPQLGQEAFATEYRREIGGGTAITACGIATLGSRTTVLAVAGREDGLVLAHRLASFGVDTSRLQFETAEPTGFSVVATMERDRAFLTYPGANRMFDQALREASRTGQLAIARHVHLAYPPRLDDAVGLLNEIRSNGCTISLDVGWHEEWLNDPRALELIQHVNIFFPNEAEASRLTGKTDPAAILEEFHKAGADCVALKLGPQGSALLWSETITFAPPWQVTPVDTTGAGDSFNAGFLHAWLTGETPGNCLLMANICGALSTESYGGVGGFPSRDRLRGEMDRKGQS
ncbi:MAG TPA: carbohydrate kinase family protein [Bryobacteraceae bacterium]|jgi:sugar/nucleoside kinase (ribokinase family)|nr:carbohydrate kinase family protein [Bryobacteraceae bacterium]